MLFPPLGIFYITYLYFTQWTSLSGVKKVPAHSTEFCVYLCISSCKTLANNLIGLQIYTQTVLNLIQMCLLPGAIFIALISISMDFLHRHPLPAMVNNEWVCYFLLKTLANNPIGFQRYIQTIWSLIHVVSFPGNLLYHLSLFHPMH